MPSAAEIRRQRLARLQQAADDYVTKEKERIDDEVAVLQSVLDGRNAGAAIQWDGVKIVSAAAESALADFLIVQGGVEAAASTGPSAPGTITTVAPPDTSGPKVKCPRCWKRGTELNSSLPCRYCKGDGLVVDQKLSKHFMLSQLVYSKNAEAAGMPNDPTDPVVANLTDLATSLLDPIYEGFGPVTVSSGYRALYANTKAGGVGNSAHSVGYASDLEPASGTVKSLMEWVVASGLTHDQFIYEKTWVHVALYRPTGEQRSMALMMFSGTYSSYNPSDPRVV